MNSLSKLLVIKSRIYSLISDHTLVSYSFDTLSIALTDKAISKKRFRKLQTFYNLLNREFRYFIHNEVDREFLAQVDYMIGGVAYGDRCAIDRDWLTKEINYLVDRMMAIYDEDVSLYLAKCLVRRSVS